MYANASPRWQGLALLIGGILLGLGLLIHPDEVGDPGAVAGGRWALSHLILLIGSAPTLLGLSYLYQRTESAIGLVGYVIFFTGLSLIISAFALESFVIPVIAADSSAQALLDPAGPLLGGALGMFFLIICVLFTMGAIILGVAVLRSESLPKWIGVLFIVGSPVALVPPLPYPLLLVGGLALGAALIATGFTAWSGRDVVVKPELA